MNERRIISKKDLLLLGLVLLSALLAAAFFIPNGQDDSFGVAVVSIGGKRVCRIDLAGEEPFQMDLRGEYGVPVLLEFRDHAVRFLRSECPDHLCEKAGFIALEGQSAVCMPNRTAVTVYARQDAEKISLEK